MANDNYELAHLFLKSLLLTAFFLLLFILLTAASVGVYTYRQLLSFTTTADTTPREFFQTLETGWTTIPQQTANHKNVLILGVDTLETRGNSQPLTDTMILASLDLKTGQVNTLSLPRDLWNDKYATKINALYSYGESHYPGQPEKLPTVAIQEISGVPIHHTLVLSLDQVAAVIDLLGGVEVEVPQSFTDTTFPRPDVDVTIERDPARLYQTVSFTQGREKMSGERALQFIRSRHAEGDEGSDVARSNRQQLVIQSLMTSALSKEILFNPTKLGQLYRFYQENFASSIPVEEIIGTARMLLPVRNGFTLTPHSLSIYPEVQTGVLIHPPLSKQHQNQWVYIIRDQDQFKQEIQQKLSL